LELLEALDKYANGLRRKGGDFAVYLEHRKPASHDLPEHLVKIREGNEESVQYFLTREELAEFGNCQSRPESGLSGEQESDTSLIEKIKERWHPARTTRELYESHAIKELLEKLAKKGFSVEHYSAQDKPLFEVIEGEGEKQTNRPLFSIPEILSSIRKSDVEDCRSSDSKGWAR